MAEGHVAPLRLGSIANCRSERVIDHGGYQAASRTHFSTPVPLHHFVDYGLWYQRQAAPGLDQRKIARVESDSKGFRLMLQDGETILASRLACCRHWFVHLAPARICRLPLFPGVSHI